MQELQARMGLLQIAAMDPVGSVATVLVLCRLRKQKSRFCKSRPVVMSPLGKYLADILDANGVDATPLKSLANVIPKLAR